MALCLPTLAFGQAAIATSDTYVNSASASTNYGAQGVMTVNSTNTGLVQFDLSPLTSGGITASNIQLAIMTVYVRKVTVGGAIDVSLATTSWSEGTVNYSSKPLTAAPFISDVPVTQAGE